VLVLGIGNILLRDEGIGPRFIKEMRNCPLPDQTELLDGGTAGAALLEFISDREKLVVIDAVEAGAKPGSIVKIDAKDLPKQPADRFSLHQFGLLDTLATAEKLGRAPKQTVIIGVQPRDLAAGTELSAELSAAMPRIKKLVLEEIDTALPASRKERSQCS
jgi:hydrogenase maturation protease